MLRSAIEAHGGWLFKHTGDGVCAAFGSARAAIDAAVEAQQTLGLPVRMGIATGEAERRGEDYFGPVLNRTARVMAAGHGGQILVAASTAAVVSGVDLVDRGEHRLRDLSGVEHLYQVRAEGLRVEFAPLRTLDAVPGNLPVQTTSFVGRDDRGEGAGRAGAGPSAGDPDRGGRGGQDPPGGPGRGRADRRVPRRGVAGRVGARRRPGGRARRGGHRVGRHPPGRASR